MSKHTAMPEEDPDENEGKVDGSIQSQGGKARDKALSKERKSEIARAAAQARWNNDLPIAPFIGEIKIGEKRIPCAVLEDGTRLVTSSGLLMALDRPWRGTYATEVRTETPNFLSATNLNPFISDELRAVLIPIRYRTENGAIKEGYRAELVRMVCNVYLQAWAAGVLKKNQEPIARAASIVMNALAEVGITALIDEATGYQDKRAKDALAKILEQFVAKELRPYAQTFPLEFYKQIFRLKKWPFDPESVRRPQVIGHYTNDFIYARLAPGVLDELRKKNPKDDKGRRKHKNFQWLTGEIGIPKLLAHFEGVTSLMKISDGMEQFRGLLKRVYPKTIVTELGFEIEGD